ncbi:MAG TPA: GNAT family N-acetyltransferase [Candidatus Microsaccharimonas sp.]
MTHNPTPEFLSQNFIIKKASPDDAAGLFDVQRKTWIATYPNPEIGITEEDIKIRIEGIDQELVLGKVERWKSTIGDGDRKISVAKINDKVVGFVAPFYDEASGQHRLGALYVLPETQGTGVGSALLRQAFEDIGTENDIYLHVVSYNQNAVNFYTKNGFQKTGKDTTGSVSALPSGNHIPEIEMLRLATK